MVSIEIIGGLMAMFPIYGLLFSMNRKLGRVAGSTRANSDAIDRLENHVYGRGPADN